MLDTIYRLKTSKNNIIREIDVETHTWGERTKRILWIPKLGMLNSLFRREKEVSCFVQISTLHGALYGAHGELNVTGNSGPVLSIRKAHL